MVPSDRPRELMAFEGTSLPNGMTRFAAAPGAHDDLTVAMMLAWQAANRPQVDQALGNDASATQASGS